MQAAFSWAQVLGVAALLVVLGRGLDILVLPHQAERLQKALLRWWNRVDDLRFTNIPRTMIGGYVAIERRLFGRRLSPRWILTALAFSGVLTTLAVYGGRLLAFYLLLECQGIEQPESKLYWGLLQSWAATVRAELLYPLNLGFDFVTLLTTITLLSILVRRATEIGRYAIIVADIITCCALYYTCFYLAHYYANPLASGIVVSFLDFGTHVVQTWDDLGCTWFHVYFSSVLFSSTIFFPTITYLVAILFVMLAHTSLQMSKWILRHLLELGATGQRTVFFYTATFLSILISSGKLVYELFLLVSSLLARS